MVPPNDTANAPLSTWQQASAHDTARECETEKREMIALFFKDAFKESKGVKIGGYSKEAYIVGRCIPADSILVK